MTDAEGQELLARLEGLERSNRRWKLLATVLGVAFLLLLSLGVLVDFDVRVRQAAQLRMAIEGEQRARMEAEDAAMRARVTEEQLQEVEAEARRRVTRGTTARAPAPPGHIPRADEP